MIPLAQVRLPVSALRAVERVLRSGKLRQGPFTGEFERRFAKAVGARRAVAVNSGTSALYLAYRALLEPGDEIIVPDFTFVATASMALAAGLKPVFADVSDKTYTLDPKDVERRITKRTRALAPVHLYGHPADVAGLTRLAKRHRLKIIWDAAQAHGARFGARDVGALPDAVCYSFYPTKNLTTGEGGMITTSDAKLANELRLLRSHGEESRYRHVRVGFNFRLTDFASALGLEQLRALAANLRHRQRNARRLARGLRDVPGIVLPQTARGATHAFNLFTIVLRPEILKMSREDFSAALARRGVETAVHYPLPLHRQPIFRGYGSDADFPVSTRLARTVVSLPAHPGLSARDLERIVRAVREVVSPRQRRSD
jgi:dTDP-4-amino-4,6-dideoxygalactose transaminase